MKVTVNYNKGMSFTGKNEIGLETNFDTDDDRKIDHGATPMQILLQAAASCSGIDIIGILNKRKIDIIDFKIDVEGEKREEYPRIFNKVKMHYTLTSKNAKDSDLERAIELSHSKYCSVSATLTGAGADLTTSFEIKKP